MAEYLVNHRYDFAGYVVTDTEGKINKIEGKDVKSVCDLQGLEDIGIIISVNYPYKEEIENVLKEMSIRDYIYGY